MEQAVANYTNAGIPLEAIWLDIPYMDKYADFSVDSQTFPTIKDYVENVLHKYDQKIVVILDGGISADDLSNKYYQMAQELNVTIQSTIHPDLYNRSIVMKVWPN